MTPFELKHLRRAIGASVARMAELLGLDGDNAADSVRKMENGSRPISGPIARLAKYMQEGVAEGGMSAALPEFVICSDMADDIQLEWVFHTRYPRFLAAVTDEPVDGTVCASLDNLEWLSVAMWIDEPVGDPVECVTRAAVAFADYTEAAMND